MMKPSAALAFLLALPLAPLVAGCGTEPSPPDPASRVDPAAGDFVLSAVEAPGGTRLRLVGRELQVDPANGRLRLELSVRNEGEAPIFPPLDVLVHGFLPRGVHPANADRHYTDRGGVETWAYRYAAVDSGGIGPGGETAPREWVLEVPGLVPFSFGARVAFPDVAPAAQLGGTVYLEGAPGDDPVAFPGGAVLLTRPDGSQDEAQVGDFGHYRFALEGTGLHELRYLPPPSFAPVCITTPNPLQVVITPDEQGDPRGFGRANFGVDPACHVKTPPVRLFRGDPPGVPRDPFTLLGAGAEGHVVWLQVGFSGCDPEQPFALLASVDFEESEPVQSRAIVAHDNEGQLCDAWFERRLRFDATPLLDAYAEAYGAPGPVVLRLEGPPGTVYRVRLEP